MSIDKVSSDQYNVIAGLERIKPSLPSTEQKVDIAELKKAADTINTALQDTNTKVTFGSEDGIPWSKVVNAQTGVTIRQIPPKEMIDVWVRIRQAMTAFINRNSGKQ